MAVDFSEDFLQKITAINFGGGDWVRIQLTGTINAFVETRMRVDLPDQSGGTPGFFLFDGTGVGHGEASYLMPSNPSTGAIRITKAMLSQKLSTGGGSELTAFGFYDARPFAIPNVLLFIKLDGSMPASPFRLRISIAYDFALTGTMIVQTIKGKSMVPLGQPPVSSATVEGPDDGSPRDFRVDPDTLQVTLLPP
jgi:hypothetical protein